MMHFDHVGIEARDASASASALAEILGLSAPCTEGADNDMFRVDIGRGEFLLFSPAAAPKSSHIAFHADEDSFAQIVERLTAKGIPFGNDPEDPSNGRLNDPIGVGGRVYFVDDNGHLFEVTF